MAQSTILAAGTTSADSSDVVVTSTPVTLALFSGEADLSMPRCKLAILQKDPNGNYQTFFDEYIDGHPRRGAFLYNTHRQYTIKTPGTFRVHRDVYLKSIGVSSDS